MKAYQAIIFYLILLGFVSYGIGQVKKSLPTIRQELGLIENRMQEYKNAGIIQNN